MISTFLSRFALLGLMLSLIGCASSYVPPSSTTPTARLRILQRENHNAMLQKLKSPCLPTGHNSATSGRHHEKINNSDGRLDMLDPPALPAIYTEIAIDATQPFHLGYNIFSLVPGYPVGTTYNCSNGLTFNPVVGESYEAVISMPTKNQCRIEISRFSELLASRTRVPVADVVHIRKQCE